MITGTWFLRDFWQKANNLAGFRIGFAMIVASIIVKMNFSRNFGWEGNTLVVKPHIHFSQLTHSVKNSFITLKEMFSLATL
jgi:hypothetical protein